MAPTTDSSGPFKNIALLGAGGSNIGSYIAQALSKGLAFTTTIIAWKSSKSTYPLNTTVIRINDDLPHAELVAALRAQDVLISAVGHDAKKIDYRLVNAALEAGVKRRQVGGGPVGAGGISAAGVWGGSREGGDERCGWGSWAAQG
ncbi:uncharacterized protein LTR77_010928 [Saxophila tyrrhenica]|uniref:Uncharacterized protein n=1 Tax=Saxophila tyrrhenica TaxID=1690608 RepID=A0AAV9NVW6_9PEZI|nr:hypothetical protein LTR77_010928 [Saxophila tyrrhenica]